MNDQQEQITIDNFRNELDEPALERGWYYFRCEWVQPPREIMPGYFEAVVEEVNPHAVSYSCEEEVYTDIFCTCGDKNYFPCRHFAAVLFYLEHQLYGDEAPQSWEALEQEKLRTLKLSRKNKK